MSIVITVLDPKKAIQVSDTRVTRFTDQSVRSNIARKTILVLGKKAKFLAGWVGFAVDATGRHETGRWLWETLVKMDAVELTIKQIAARLASAATSELAPLMAANKSLQIVMAGWDASSFVVTVSNSLKVRNKRKPHPSDKKHHIPSISETKCSETFSVNIQRYAKNYSNRHAQRYNRAKSRDYLVTVVGDFTSDKLGRHFTKLKKRLKKNVLASEITDVCRETTLEASNHTKTIGRTLIGVGVVQKRKERLYLLQRERKAGDPRASDAYAGGCFDRWHDHREPRRDFNGAGEDYQASEKLMNVTSSLDRQRPASLPPASLVLPCEQPSWLCSDRRQTGRVLQ
jgi:hypothetical protein